MASRPDKNLKTFHFEDRIWDKGRECWVPRRLTISASDEYGLPTALDDELVLGLIQLAREEESACRKVFFSRYRLLKILGWRTEGKNYARLETSLKPALRLSASGATASKASPWAEWRVRGLMQDK